MFCFFFFIFFVSLCFVFILLFFFSRYLMKQSSLKTDNRWHHLKWNILVLTFKQNTSPSCISNLKMIKNPNVIIFQKKFLYLFRLFSSTCNGQVESAASSAAQWRCLINHSRVYCFRPSLCWRWFRSNSIPVPKRYHRRHVRKVFAIGRCWFGR